MSFSLKYENIDPREVTEDLLKNMLNAIYEKLKAGKIYILPFSKDIRH